MENITFSGVTRALLVTTSNIYDKTFRENSLRLLAFIDVGQNPEYACANEQ